MAKAQLNFGELSGGTKLFDQSYAPAELPVGVSKTINVDFAPKLMIMYCNPTGAPTHAIRYDIENSAIYATSANNGFEIPVTLSWLNTILSSSGNSVTYTVPNGWDVDTRIMIIG